MVPQAKQQYVRDFMVDMRARQEQAAVHSQAQRSSTLEQVRSRLERQSSLHSHTVGSGDDHTDYDNSVSREESVGQDESVGHPVDWTLIRGHAAKVIFEGLERTPPILECRPRKKTLDLIIRLQDMSDELYRVLPASPLGRLLYIMHQHIDSALITAFELVLTVHFPWNRLIKTGSWAWPAFLGSHCRSCVRRGTSPAVALTWVHCCSYATVLRLWILKLLLVDKTRVGMRPHPVLAVAADQADIARGTLTLAYLYRQLGMATRTGCKTIAGCLILLQIWIYEYFPAFRPNLRQADMPNKTRAEMWSPQKPIRELSRLRDCRSILDAMIETQVEWTPYMTSARALLNEHPRIAYIGGITCFDVVEVYLPERTVRQLGFAQDIPPPPLRPTQAVRPAQGSYSVTFSSSPMFTEMWSRFPYCARVVEQALRRTSVPSEAGPDYVDWFRVSSHCFLIPGEGPAAAFGVADNRVKYFAAEYSARLAPLLRMPAIAQMTPRKRDVADMYLDDLRELFAEWQQCRGRSP
ncbi:uncharacterized protein LOC130808250 [Amaranthus tricolor]|uniref:uncharacterized protein LOC130808248 n=2 Tax=Amaranthus tricolor TaxID=29722 RepID=UPI002583DD93|nr:uncharacterized protein LOC130808248 [Amaranthus tricolor]XP_057529714.1 uncharacterized protein LOC130808249 [Amaranthus tricolor]XP_057529715.1 uncharacterized protein LOC130808250 [Amaranthus tricolor]